MVAAAAGRENEGRAACQLVMTRSPLQSVEEGEEAGAAGKVTKVQTAVRRQEADRGKDRPNEERDPSLGASTIHTFVSSFTCCLHLSCLPLSVGLPAWLGWWGRGTQD